MHRGLKDRGSGARALAATMACALLTLLVATPASAGDLPPGFQETRPSAASTDPTVVRFAPDGRVFVAEKSGLIKVFDGLDDTTPTMFADLRTKVHNYWDRGLLGMALDPNFPSQPYVYVLYTYDAAIGGTAPRWGRRRQPHRRLPGPAGADRRRLRRQRPALALGSAGGGIDDRHRAGAGRGLVPAVPEPLGRRAGSSAPDGAL